MPRILYFFALCNLVIGSSAFVLGGILQPVSQALGVSVAAAGQVITAYAIATAVLAPVLMIWTAKWSRKRTVQFALGLFTFGAFTSAIAPTLSVLLVGRVLMGAGAMFTALVAGLAVGMVPPAQRGRALSITFLGMSVSYAVGLPIGAWLGFEYGWRVPVWLCAGASLCALLATTWLMPNKLVSATMSFAGFSAVAKQGAVLRVWLRTLLYFIAIFSVFAYVGPVLLTLNPMSSTLLSITLAVFGSAGVVGTLVGGWANDRFGSLNTIRVQLTVLTSMMVLLPFTEGHLPLTLATLVTWGIAGFGLMMSQQSRLAALSPAQSPLLLSLNSSMLYLGTALGAIVSGTMLGVVGLAHLGWVGAPFGLLGLFTLVFDKPIAQAAHMPSAA